MNKIKLILRAGADGQTPLAQPPTFTLVDGWNEADIAGPVGLLPAGLWGQVPAGDPYLVHACLLTSQPIEPTTIFEVRSGAPMQVRTQFVPSAGNLRLSLVRPGDELRILAHQQHPPLKLELLVESIGGVNELGSRLHDWVDTERRARDRGVTVFVATQNVVLAAWTRMLHVIVDSPVGVTVTLPPRATVPLDAIMTITRKGAGVPTLSTQGGDTFVGGVNNFPVQLSAIVLNNSDQWTGATAP